MPTSKFVEVLSPNMQKSFPEADVRLEDVLDETLRYTDETSTHQRQTSTSPATSTAPRSRLRRLTLKGSKATS
ncbi:MAG: hypothetical protein M4579_004168 [Chaenotheca gracillima]|nr:MAG: hypothetical protein M4579_004168 [Chaenotheca gracillima]